MNDHSNRKQLSSDFSGYLVGEAVGGRRFRLTEADNLYSYPPVLRMYGSKEYSAHLQSTQHNSSLANMPFFENEWQQEDPAHVDRFARYWEQTITSGRSNSVLLTPPSGFQNHPMAHSQYGGHYLNIGCQFEPSASLSLPVGAGQRTEGHRNTKSSDWYSPNLEIDAERVSCDLVEVPGYNSSQGSNTCYINDSSGRTGPKADLPMSAVLGRNTDQGATDALPKIVVSRLQHLDPFTSESQIDLDPHRQRESRSGLPPPDGAPHSPGSVISGDALRCSHSGCTSEFHGLYRRGNLARHCRLKHKGQVVQYKCEVSYCMRLFKRQDARLKHYRKCHPELTRRSGMLQEPTLSTGTGNVPGYLDSPQETYRMTSPYNSQLVNAAQTPAVSAGRTALSVPFDEVHDW